MLLDYIRTYISLHGIVKKSRREREKRDRKSPGEINHRIIKATPAFKNN